MLDLLQKCFPEKFASSSWQNKLKEIIPSFGEHIDKDATLCERMRAWTGEVLGLKAAV